MIAFETEAKNVAAGDIILGPTSGTKLLVRAVVPVEWDDKLLELQCLSPEGKRVALTLDADWKLRVLDA